MPNQIDYDEAAYLDLERLKSLEWDAVERLLDAAEAGLMWYDPWDDPNRAGDLTVYRSSWDTDTLSLDIDTLRFLFEIDAAVKPFVVTVLRVELINPLRLYDPTD